MNVIEIRYLNKNGNGVYQDAKSMEEAELIAQEMNRKGFQNVMIVNDGKDSWETYKKWLKRNTTGKNGNRTKKKNLSTLF